MNHISIPSCHPINYKHIHTS